MMGYIYMLTAITSDFLAILIQKQSPNVNPYVQMTLRSGTLFGWNCLIASQMGISPEPISSKGLLACIKRAY